MTTLVTATNLTAYTFARAPGAGWTTANIAAIKAGILDDQNTSHPIAQLNGSGGFYDNGILYVPNRGFLQCLPGDVLAFDTQTGFPIVVSKAAIAGGGWTFT